MSGEPKIRVGSRKSELALIQTHHVISLLQKVHPNKEFEVVTMTTLGDQIVDIPLPKIGEKSLFTKELETALASGHVDFIVHSLKDLPTVLPAGMAVGAVLSRENPRDALVLRNDIKSGSLATLPAGSTIGTSSLRRTAQLAKKYPHLKVENIRGNLNTRLKKLDDLGKYNAIILACAGLIRIGWKDRISKILDVEEFMYAVGQGAIAVECRANDDNIIRLLEPLYDLQTALRIVAERSFLKTLGGGCSAPVAVTSDLKLIKDKEVKLSLKGAVWSLNGSEEIISEDACIVNVLNNIKCAECPYANGDDKVADIECCVACPMYKPNGPNPKKIKLDVQKGVLENDPHDACPLPIPIGADFMGQCPYLDGDLEMIHSRVPMSNTSNMLIEGLSVCPFLNAQKTENDAQPQNDIPSASESEDSVVGLVPHKGITREQFLKANKLGENLAKKLIEKGAAKVMEKAQALVHGQINKIAVKN